MSAGYSGTPLTTKLGVKDEQRCWRLDMPAAITAEIGDVPLRLDAPEPGLEMAHGFTTRGAELETELRRLRSLIAPARMVWVSWPKKAAKIDTDITEDVVRRRAADGLRRRGGARGRCGVGRAEAPDPQGVALAAAAPLEKDSREPVDSRLAGSS